MKYQDGTPTKPGRYDCVFSDCVLQFCLISNGNKLAWKKRKAIRG